MAEMVLKVVGHVSYSDGTHGPIETSNHRTIVSNPFADDSIENFSRLALRRPSKLDSFLSQLPSMLSLMADPPNEDKEISDFTLNISGLISRDDGTSEGFVIEYFNDNVNHFPESTDRVWVELEDEFSDLIIETFEAIVGEGNATL